MKIYSIGIDIKRSFTSILKGIVQNEDVQFKTVISDEGKPINYTACNIIMIAVRMPDYTTEKTLDILNIETANAAKGILEFKLPKEFTMQKGVHQLQISFLENGNIVKTARFNYLVEEGLILDEPSETEIKTTEDLLQKVSKALVTNEEISEAETLRINEEQRRAAAERERNNKEGNRTLAETLRIDEEQRRAAAERERNNKEGNRELNEANRVMAEDNRILAETERKNNETNRTKQIERLKYYGDADIIPSNESLFAFTLNNDGKGYSIAANWDKEFQQIDKIVIPYEHNGLPVVTIGDSAFSNCYFLTSITIPNSVTSIGVNAFYHCPLNSITIPDSVTSIGNRAFESCNKLTKVEIPESVKSIGLYAFASCDSLTKVTIPDSVTSIGEDVFHECFRVSIICSQGSYAEQYAKENEINIIYDKVYMPDTVPTENSNKLITSGAVAKAIKNAGGGAGGNIEVDDVPTEGSSKLITSGGVYTAIGDIETSLENIIAKYGLGGEN